MRCPACGSARTAPVVYGLPGGDTLAKAERGEAILGGCVITPDLVQDDRGCIDCGARWSELERPAERARAAKLTARAHPGMM